MTEHPKFVRHEFPPLTRAVSHDGAGRQPDEGGHGHETRGGLRRSFPAAVARRTRPPVNPGPPPREGESITASLPQNQRRQSPPAEANANALLETPREGGPSLSSILRAAEAHDTAIVLYGRRNYFRAAKVTNEINRLDELAFLLRTMRYGAVTELGAAIAKAAGGDITQETLPAALRRWAAGDRA